MGKSRTHTKRELRQCHTCGTGFWFRLCYAKRPGTPGRFCSSPCRYKALYGKGNPNVTELAANIGSKAAKRLGRATNQALLRNEVLALLSPEGVCCANCGCNDIGFLQVNHKNGVPRERRHVETGARLWRMVKSLGEPAREFFDVLCVMCNWLDHYKRTGETMHHNVIWKKDL